MARQLNEGHLCVLRDFDTARKIGIALEELEEIICGCLGEYVNEWVKNHLGDEWTGEYDLYEDNSIYFWKKSWMPAHDPSENPEPLACFGFTIYGQFDEEEYWATHLLGLAQESFKAGYFFDGLIEAVDGKDEAAKRTRGFADRLKGYVSYAKKKKELSFYTTVRLEAAKLATALQESDLDAAFQPVTVLLEEFKGHVDEVDAIVASALNG